MENRNDGVNIRISGNISCIKNFIEDIRKESPPASNILSVESFETEAEEFNDFSIVKSKDQSGEITEISPDIAVCEDCLKDMQLQKNRIKYPFINCTNCGPRFTIIKDLPYDRDKNHDEKISDV